MNWDDALKAAIVGTQSGPPAGLPPREPEEALLLLAAQRQIGSRSGFRPLKGVPLLDVAPSETLPYLPSEHRSTLFVLATVLGALPGGIGEAMLNELVQVAGKRGFICPPVLQPFFLIAFAKHKRADWMPFIGERGKWLAKQNEEWKPLLSAFDPQPNAWDEGTLAERCAFLTSLRSSDPAQARALLIETWSKENAKTKKKLLECLTVGLGTEDEEFLTKCTGDKSKEVRHAARLLLCRIPDSAYEKRVKSYVFSCMELKKQLLGGRTLSIKLPGALPAEWAADGLDYSWAHYANPVESAFALVLRMLDPTAYERQYELTALELFKIFNKHNRMTDYIQFCILSATLEHSNAAWAKAFVFDYLDMLSNKVALTHLIHWRFSEVASVMNQADYDDMLLKPMYKNWDYFYFTVISNYPYNLMGDRLGELCVDQLAMRSQGMQNDPHERYVKESGLEKLALVLPSSLLERAEKLVEELSNSEAGANLPSSMLSTLNIRRAINSI